MAKIQQFDATHRARILAQVMSSDKAERGAQQGEMRATSIASTNQPDWRSLVVAGINRKRKGERDFVPFVFSLGAIGEPITPRVDHGRWLADCPYCLGAEMVELVSGSEFYCFSCGMKENNGHPRPIAVPINYRAIEKILESRAESKHQNWTGETLEELRHESEVK